MPTLTAARAVPPCRLKTARRVLAAEADALHEVADRLDTSFDAFTEVLFRCPGRVAVVGVGKSSDVARKIAGTLNSTGTRAYHLDATRAVHGDLGMVHPEDVALILSHSGESAELVALLRPLREQCSALLALTSRRDNTVARAADVVLAYGPLDEACPLALAPSTSTTAMMALGDAVAFTLLELREFTATDFARFHPAGSLGRKLASVGSAMRSGDELRVAPQTRTVREVFASAKHVGRRTGAVMLTDADGRLAGLFTDSDLARLFERRDDAALDRPVSAVMTRDPLTVGPAAKLGDAVRLLRERKVSELPVVDADGRPIGMIDITDVIGAEPAAARGPAPLQVVGRAA